MSIEDRRSDDLVQRIQSLTRQLDELRAMIIGRLPGAIAAGGSIVFPDENGNPLARFGVLTDGSTGMQITSTPNTFDLVKMTSDGWIKPHLQGSSYDQSNSKAVTSGTFATQYSVLFGDYMGPGIEVLIPWVTAAATTGELQVVTAGGTFTSTFSLPAASTGSTFVRWLHGRPVGNGPAILGIQARRATGAGAVTIFPANAWIQDPSLCSSGGNWI